MADKKLTLGEKWAKLPSGTKTLIGGVPIGIILLVVGQLLVGEPAKKDDVNTKPKTEIFNAGASQANSIEGSASDIAALKDTVRQQSDKLKLMDEQERQRLANGGADGKYSEIANLTAQVQQLQERMNNGAAGNINTNAASNLPAPNLNGGLPAPGSNNPNSTPVADKQDAPPSIQVIKGEPRAPKADKAAASKKTVAYLPAGSNFEAILINGMDASTSIGANKVPTPALLRIKTDAILPNLFSQDVTECFVLAGGFGNLSSERVELRTEKMSCVNEAGEAFEADIQGYIVGEDGKVGARGVVVSKQGSLLAKSFMAGFVGGIGQAFTPQPIPTLNTGGTQTYNYPSPSNVAGTGVGQGLNKSSQTLAQFYIEMAKQMFPIVQLDAGRKVTIILIKGTEVKK